MDWTVRMTLPLKRVFPCESLTVSGLSRSRSLSERRRVMALSFELSEVRVMVWSSTSAVMS